MLRSLPLLILMCTLAAAESVEDAVDLLFLGSSSTFYNDMPMQVADWVGSIDTVPVQAHWVGIPVVPISDYLPPVSRRPAGIPRDSDILSFIAEFRAEYVVLQAVGGFFLSTKEPPADGLTFQRAIDTYCAAIRAAGGEPVFYEMEWKQQDIEAARQAIFDSAVRNRVTRIVPCAAAWQRLLAEHPELDPRDDNDAWHPGVIGTYLNLCCFYAAFTGERPTDETVPHQVLDWWGKGHEIGDEAVADMQRRIDAGEVEVPPYISNRNGKRTARAMLELRTVPIPPETRRILHTLAWESWQTVNDRLQAALAEHKEQP